MNEAERSHSIEEWLHIVDISNPACQGKCDRVPFGDGLNCNGNTDPGGLHFTGKEHDKESQNDYFGARYYTSSIGNFISPDDGSDQDASNPQSWNLYSYTRNNPLSYTDDNGHDVNVCGVETFGGLGCHEVSNDEYQFAQGSVNDGALNVPSLDELGNSQDASDHFITMDITTKDGQFAGTATYVPTDNFDPYLYKGAYQVLGAAGKAVNYITAGTALTYGVVGGAVAGPEAAQAIWRLGLQRLAAGASSSALINLINKIYQEQDEISGGTAGAVRNEVGTGGYIKYLGGHAEMTLPSECVPLSELV